MVQDMIRVLLISFMLWRVGLGWVKAWVGLGWVKAWVGLGLVKTFVNRFFMVHGWVIWWCLGDG